MTSVTKPATRHTTVCRTDVREDAISTYSLSQSASRGASRSTNDNYCSVQDLYRSICRRIRSIHGRVNVIRERFNERKLLGRGRKSADLRIGATTNLKSCSVALAAGLAAAS